MVSSGQKKSYLPAHGTNVLSHSFFASLMARLAAASASSLSVSRLRGLRGFLVLGDGSAQVQPEAQHIRGVRR